ncbi:uncharacterized protein BX663DRAFT_544123 [Cokeromyces recurvatus]|uniref:uncharacterized protein n=1 Tax=Cokeromyces recurvatus TaxID=90255 RepID=UPI002220A945|nr:uncharacterized protein BX663DRAFT_544123 [Cokeromyces recurvatus]KAI7901351.1 hypothetical protein BX663DRAFT_544123 [Cokeromyces recurvatus]
MSTSGLIAAKKRIENAARKYEIPIESTPTDVDSYQNGILFLSLFQSRLNWTSSVFSKYKLDPVQQPKRTTHSRKKWPNMKYISTCNLELGAHVFMNTPFYKAIRCESWGSIAKSQGLNVPEEETAQLEQKEETLTFVDIVFELKDVPNERFIFPKDTILEIIPISGEAYKTIHASFILPLDENVADEFFMSPKDKILKYGESSQLSCIQEFIKLNKDDKKKSKEIEKERNYQPVNIRMTKADLSLVEALENYVYKMQDVRRSMKDKLKHAQGKKSYIKFDLSDDLSHSNKIQELVKKATTVPDLTTGPIQAEKKRNEILNAIKLGKRERDEKFESELPKNKYINVKEDTLFKCAYCSTKYTTMWRSGPAGHGTLCNSCGIQWKQGEILIDAPVISMKEERRIIKEKKERERAAELAELEKTEHETKRHQKKNARQETSYQVQDLGRFAVQLLQQKYRHQGKKGTIIPEVESSTHSSEGKKKSNKETIPKSKEQLNIIDNTSSNQTSPSLQPQVQPPQDPPKPLSLYSPAGIPLPTLSIEFANQIEFIHPNCGITMLDRYLSVRLCKNECEQTTIELHKKDLINATFEVVNEWYTADQQREVLKMKVSPPDSKTCLVFGQSIHSHPIVIRYLEKLDPNGGAVVQRIIQRWLITAPQE